jgi:hypothetical protein
VSAAGPSEASTPRSTLRDAYLRLPLWGKTVVGLFAAKLIFVALFLFFWLAGTVLMLLPWLALAIAAALQSR